MFPKKKRIVNLELIKSLRNYTCHACGKGGNNDVHHVTERGAGGDDVASNLITLCRKHHTMWHTEGTNKFLWKFPKVKEWLVTHKRFDVLDKLDLDSETLGDWGI